MEPDGVDRIHFYNVILWFETTTDIDPILKMRLDGNLGWIVGRGSGINCDGNKGDSNRISKLSMFQSRSMA
jgi:hypothetical protein